MKDITKVGIYMDHSHAIFYDFGILAVQFKAITLDFNQEDKHDVL